MDRTPTGRYVAATELFRAPTRRVASALRESLRAYRFSDLRADVLAGLVVGVVSLPLAMALAIAAGVPPQQGLYTAIVAGAVAPLFGGSRVNVTGPTASFVVLAPISAQYGLAGLALASMFAGVILAVMGVSRLGRLVQFIPHPVTTGFTTGIGVVIALLQVKDFLGLQVGAMPLSTVDRVGALFEARGTASGHEILIGAFTLGILILFPKITRRFPAPLVAVASAAVLAYLLQRFVAGFQVATIGDRFSFRLPDGTEGHGIPQALPHVVLPWTLPGANGEPLRFDYATVRQLVPPAFAIAMLGAIESLLCAIVADSLTGHRHDPNVELVGQGLGNFAAAFFGGFAATGAIARTATSVRAGARSPIAAVTHAAFILASVLALAPLLSHLPMAALAALLLMVAWNLADVKHFVRILRIAPRSDLLVLLACFGLTVAFDMVIAVGVGVVLAALLFMQRMSELTTLELVRDAPVHEGATSLPPNTLVYDIGGPLFFGAAERAVQSLARVAGDIRSLILDLGDVPHVDVSALVELESVVATLQRRGTLLVFCNVARQPLGLFEKSTLLASPTVLVAGTRSEAIELVRQRIPAPAVAPATA